MIVANRCISRIDRLRSIIFLCVRRRYVRTAIFVNICERALSVWYKWFCLYVGYIPALGARLSVVRARPEFLLFSAAVAVSNFFSLRDRSSNSPTIACRSRLLGFQQPPVYSRRLRSRKQVPGRPAWPNSPTRHYLAVWPSGNVSMSDKSV